MFWPSRLEFTMSEPLESRNAEYGKPEGPPSCVSSLSAPGFSSDLFLSFSWTTRVIGTKYFSNTGLMSCRSRKASSRLHQIHHDAPKCRKIALCSADALALASAKTCSAEGDAADAK